MPRISSPARAGAPAVVGLGIDENFVASDVAALLPVTRNFMFLEEGDVALVERKQVTIWNERGEVAERPVRESELDADAAERGEFRHFMLKEIYEQSAAVARTLDGRIADGRVLDASFGPLANAALDKTRGVHIVACGTSYHAGLVARYWLEEIGIPCSVEVASEYRYRPVVVSENTLFVTISNDETAATEAWKILKAESVQNVYILEGGINGWLDTYAHGAFDEQDHIADRAPGQLAYRFNAATGARHPAADPNPHLLDLSYEPKVILELKRAPTGGGCG